MKKKLIISLIAIFLFLGVIFAIGALANESEDNPRDMIRAPLKIFPKIIKDMV